MSSPLFEGQAAHALGLALLLAALVPASRLSGFDEGELWGLSTPTWFAASIAAAVAHQVYVWLCWRLELHRRAITRRFGGAGFRVYAAVFAVLILMRPVTITLLAVANRGAIESGRPAMRVLAVVLAALGTYTLVSVARYFGFERAVGRDHFDPDAGEVPLERRGVFRWTPNAMYVFGIGALWIPGLWTGSTAALVAAAFSHAYIWVHWLATERPDMRRIYGARPPVVR
jgi:hypothetical protein